MSAAFRNAVLSIKAVAFAVGVAALCPGSIANTQTEPLGGQPPPGAKQSESDLEAQVAYQRAFEAVLWAMQGRLWFVRRSGRARIRRARRRYQTPTCPPAWWCRWMPRGATALARAG